MNKILQRLVVIGLVGSLGLWGAERFRSNAALSALEQGFGASSGQQRTSSLRRTPEQQRARQEKRRRFARLWLARHERDITGPMLVYLRDPDLSVRERAACALGRLEAPGADSVLRELRSKMHRGMTVAQFEAMKGIPFVPLHLALGRIAARRLKGQAKLDRVVGSVGLKWPDVVAVCQRVYTPQGNSPPPQPLTLAQKQVVREVVDVLYTLRKQGQDTTDWEQQLLLPPAYKVMLQGAALPSSQEIRLILDYFAAAKVLRMEHYDLHSHLFGLKGTKQAIFGYLPTVKLNPNFAPPTGYTMLFYTATAFGDRRALPLVKRFEASSDRYVRSEAKDFRQELERNQEVIPVVP